MKGGETMYDFQAFRFWCQKVLPTVYDDSLSYYEVLCKVAHTLNELIDAVNEMEGNWRNYTDSQIAAYDKKIQAQLILIQQQIKTYIDQQDSKLENRFLAELKKLYELFTQLWQMIRMENDYTRAYVDSQIQILKDQLARITCVIVRDPFTGENAPIQTVIDKIYDALRFCAITCGQYDTLGYTCQEYDDLGLTCYEYDWLACKFMFSKSPIERGLIASPFDNSWDQPQQVISNLAGLHQDCLTTGIYDAFGWTCSQYDSRAWTCHEYDWESALLAYKDQECLTTAEYDALDWSCDTYDGKEWTCRDYDFYSKIIA